MEISKLQFGKAPSTLTPQEFKTHEYRTWAEHGAILYISSDGETYATIPTDARVLLKSYLPEDSRKRKRVPAEIEKLLLKGAPVDELTTHDSQETVIVNGQTVYVPPQWFKTTRPEQPKAIQSPFKI